MGKQVPIFGMGPKSVTSVLAIFRFLMTCSFNDKNRGIGKIAGEMDPKNNRLLHNNNEIPVYPCPTRIGIAVDDVGIRVRHLRRADQRMILAVHLVSKMRLCDGPKKKELQARRGHSFLRLISLDKNDSPPSLEAKNLDTSCFPFSKPRHESGFVPHVRVE